MSSMSPSRSESFILFNQMSFSDNPNAPAAPQPAISPLDDSATGPRSFLDNITPSLSLEAFSALKRFLLHSEQTPSLNFGPDRSTGSTAEPSYSTIHELQQAVYLPLGPNYSPDPIHNLFFTGFNEKDPGILYAKHCVQCFIEAVRLPPEDFAARQSCFRLLEFVLKVGALSISVAKKRKQSEDAGQREFSSMSPAGFRAASGASGPTGGSEPSATPDSRTPSSPTDIKIAILSFWRALTNEKLVASLETSLKAVEPNSVPLHDMVPTLFFKLKRARSLLKDLLAMSSGFYPSEMKWAPPAAHAEDPLAPFVDPGKNPAPPPATETLTALQFWKIWSEICPVLSVILGPQNLAVLESGRVLAYPVLAPIAGPGFFPPPYVSRPVTPSLMSSHVQLHQQFFLNQNTPQPGDQPTGAAVPPVIMADGTAGGAGHTAGAAGKYRIGGIGGVTIDKPIHIPKQQPVIDLGVEIAKVNQEKTEREPKDSKDPKDPKDRETKRPGISIRSSIRALEHEDGGSGGAGGAGGVGGGGAGGGGGSTEGSVGTVRTASVAGIGGDGGPGGPGDGPNAKRPSVQPLGRFGSLKNLIRSFSEGED